MSDNRTDTRRKMKEMFPMIPLLMDVEKEICDVLPHLPIGQSEYDYNTKSMIYK